MIKFENTEVMGWEAAVRGMRNPMNSWEKSDSSYGCKNEDLNTVKCNECFCKYDLSCFDKGEYKLGPKDLDLMMKLRNAGTDHRKFMRMIMVYVDITAPLYWWKEFDTYKVGTVVNSCSTMHKIHDKEFTLEDFSFEHLMNNGDKEIIYGDWVPLHVLEHVCMVLNRQRERYLETKDKRYWWQMIQLLPSSYNQKRTVMINYEVLANIYKSRKNHKLDEWSIGFIGWIESLPYSELII